MKILSTKKSNFLENLPKYVHLNIRIGYPKYKFKNSKHMVSKHDIAQIDPKQIILVLKIQKKISDNKNF